MTNSVLSAIADRRSIRNYTGELPTAEQLEALKAAAVQSPSAVNRQPYHFTFVENKELLEEFKTDVRKAFKQNEPSAPAAGEDFDVLRGAPSVCFIFADPNNHWAMLDSGIAVENLALAAHSMGLGSVILGMPRIVFETNGEKWERLLACPEGMKFAIAIGIGVPAASKDAHPVREGLISVIK